MHRYPNLTAGNVSAAGETAATRARSGHALPRANSASILLLALLISYVVKPGAPAFGQVPASFTIDTTTFSVRTGAACSDDGIEERVVNRCFDPPPPERTKPFGLFHCSSTAGGDSVDFSGTMAAQIIEASNSLALVVSVQGTLQIVDGDIRCDGSPGGPNFALDYNLSSTVVATLVLAGPCIVRQSIPDPAILRIVTGISLGSALQPENGVVRLEEGTYAIVMDYVVRSCCTRDSLLTFPPLVLTVEPAPPEDDGGDPIWISSGVGDWGDPQNWLGERVPTADDIARFLRNEAPYTVTGADVQTGGISVEGGDVTLGLGVDLIDENASVDSPHLSISGRGALTLTGRMNSPFTLVGRLGAETSRLRLEPDSRLDSFLLRVGGEGPGRFEFNAAQLVTEFLEIGNGPAGQGEARFSGSGGFSASAHSVSVGHTGPGVLVIEDGTDVRSVNGVVGDSAEGTAQIRGRTAGNPSSWVLDELQIGSTGANGVIEVTEDGRVLAKTVRVGNGEVLVDSGGQILAEPGFTLDLSVGAEGPGSVVVQGGSVLDRSRLIAESIQLGVEHTGTLEVSDGGRVHVKNIQVGMNEGALLRARGTNEEVGDEHHLKVDGQLAIGGLGTTTAVISDAGSVLADSLVIGTDSGDPAVTATVHVEGVRSPDTFLGATTARMTGRHSALRVSGTSSAAFARGLDVAPSGSADIRIEGPGTLHLGALGAATLRLGGQSAAARSEMSLRGGAVLSSIASPLDLIVGVVDGATGRVVLEGSARGSELTKMDVTRVLINNGRMEVNTGSLVTATDFVVGDPDSFALPFVDANIDSLFGHNAVLQLNAAREREILVQCDRLRVHDDGAVQFCPALAPRGRIAANVSAVFERGSSLNGEFNIVTPELEMDGRHDIGCSPGAVEVDGNYRLGETGRLVMEIGGTESDLRDQLIVSGTATFAGTLELSFVQDFLPKAGETFELIQAAGGVEGQFSLVEIKGVASDFQAAMTRSADGSLKLTALNDAAAGEGATLELPIADEREIGGEAAALDEEVVEISGGLCPASAAGLMLSLTAGIAGASCRRKRLNA